MANAPSTSVLKSLPSAERDLVRELARAVAAAARSPETEASRRRWRDVNDLRRPDRAPVWCRPVDAWNELLADSALRCADPWLRSIERDFRQTPIKLDIGDDTPVEDYLPVPAAMQVEPANTWGLEIGRHKPVGPGGAWGYDPPILEEADFARLAMPRFIHDAAETQRRLDRAGELLGDIRRLSSSDGYLRPHVGQTRMISRARTVPTCSVLTPRGCVL